MKYTMVLDKKFNYFIEHFMKLSSFVY